jgi:hypothetical protein
MVVASKSLSRITLILRRPPLNFHRIGSRLMADTRPELPSRLMAYCRINRISRGYARSFWLVPLIPILPVVATDTTKGLVLVRLQISSQKEFRNVDST